MVRTRTQAAVAQRLLEEAVHLAHLVDPRFRPPIRTNDGFDFRAQGLDAFGVRDEVVQRVREALCVVVRMGAQKLG